MFLKLQDLHIRPVIGVRILFIISCVM